MIDGMVTIEGVEVLEVCDWFPAIMCQWPGGKIFVNSAQLEAFVRAVKRGPLAPLPCRDEE